MEECLSFSFTRVTGVPVTIASASFSLVFSLATGIIKNLLKITRNKKKKHKKIVTLAKSKLNIIDTLISRALKLVMKNSKQLLIEKKSMKK